MVLKYVTKLYKLLHKKSVLALFFPVPLFQINVNEDGTMVRSNCFRHNHSLYEFIGDVATVKAKDIIDALFWSV